MRVVLLLLLTAAAAASSVDPSSLDAYLDFPQRGSLVRSWRGALAVWTSCARRSGCNLHAAGGPLTAFAADDGLYELGSLSAVPGEGFVFARVPVDGANPTALRVPPSGSVWWLQGNGSLVELVPGASGFLHAGVVGVYLFEGRQLKRYGYDRSVTTLLQLQSDQGAVTSVRDREGGDIVFVNDRGDRALVGFLGATAPSVRWLAPSLDNVLGPAVFNPWNADQVAFLREFDAVDDSAVFQSVTTTLMVASVSTGNAVAVTTFVNAPSTQQSANGHRELTWVSASAVVLPVVGAQGFDKWNHVVRVDVATRAVDDLFAGQACDVLSYFVGSNETLLATHNCFSATLDTQSLTLHNLRDQSWVPVVMGNEYMIAGLAGEREYGAVVLADGSVVYLSSTYNTSMAVYRASGPKFSSVQRLSPLDKPFPAPFVRPKTLTFLSPNFTIHGHLVLPPAGTVRGPVPAVVFTHGGPMRQLYCAFHPTWDYAFRYAMSQWLAAHGVAVISINYRMGVGYGTDFQFCSGCGALGAAEYADVLNAARFLQNQTGVIDGTRIGIYGLSYGGLNALQAATRNPDVFRVAVANAPVFNWVSESRFDGEYVTLYAARAGPSEAITYWPPEDLAGPSWAPNVDRTVATYYASSPVAYMSANMAPTLLIHGDSDRDVAVQASIGLLKHARTKGWSQVQARFFPNEVHGLSLLSSQSTAAQATVKFLLDVLLPPSPK